MNDNIVMRCTFDNILGVCCWCLIWKFKHQVMIGNKYDNSFLRVLCKIWVCSEYLTYNKLDDAFFFCNYFDVWLNLPVYTNLFILTHFEVFYLFGKEFCMNVSLWNLIVWNICR